MQSEMPVMFVATCVVKPRLTTVDQVHDYIINQEVFDFASTNNMGNPFSKILSVDALEQESKKIRNESRQLLSTAKQNTQQSLESATVLIKAIESYDKDKTSLDGIDVAQVILKKGDDLAQQVETMSKSWEDSSQHMEQWLADAEQLKNDLELGLIAMVINPVVVGGVLGTMILELKDSETKTRELAKTMTNLSVRFHQVYIALKEAIASGQRTETNSHETVFGLLPTFLQSAREVETDLNNLNKDIEEAMQALK